MGLISLLKQRGVKVLYYKIKHTFFTQDQDIRAIAARNGSCEYLQRYAHLCGSPVDKMEPGEKIIWVCWFQGIDQAPTIVQKCVESIHKYAGDYKVVEITEANYSQYVNLPDYILEKYRKGIISRIHFSDLLRFTLLTQYGGLWIDSTILLTGELPAFAIDVPLFAYRSDQTGCSWMSVNFVSCYKHHPLLEDTLRMSLAYWKAENRTIDYNISSILWTIAVQATEQNKQLWDEVPNVPCRLKDILLGELNKPYSEQKWQHICAMSPIHKLTYKFDKYGIDPAKRGTFYDVLFN